MTYRSDVYGLLNEATGELEGLLKTDMQTMSAFGAGGGGAVSQVRPSRTAVHLYPSAAVNSATFRGVDFGYVAGTVPFVNFQQVFDVEAHFDQIALIFINGSLTAPLPISKATVNVGPSAADLTMNGAPYTAVTFAGAPGVTVPVATSVAGLGTFPSYVVSDFVPLSSLARTDVIGGRPLVYTRTQLSPTVSTDPIAALQRAGADWATFPNAYGRYFAGHGKRCHHGGMGWHGAIIHRAKWAMCRRGLQGTQWPGADCVCLRRL